MIDAQAFTLTAIIEIDGTLTTTSSLLTFDDVWKLQATDCRYVV